MKVSLSGISPRKTPEHAVKITRPFALSRNEITRGQFRRFVEETGYRTDAEKGGKGGIAIVEGVKTRDVKYLWNTDSGFTQADNHPVVNVSWNDATAFCDWLSKKHGMTFTLPAEAQWEHACRAGTSTSWLCGKDDAELDQYAWYGENSNNATHPTGQLKPNSWGLCDMHGNVFELCADRHGVDYYSHSPAIDPVGPDSGNCRVWRGGAWHATSLRCRSAFRGLHVADHSSILGFRVALILDDESREDTCPEPPLPDIVSHALDLRDAIEAIDFRTANVSVEVSEPDATVTILDEDRNAEEILEGVGKTATGAIVPGEYWLRVEKKGFEIYAGQFAIEAGEEKSTKIELTASQDIKPRPAQAPFGANEAKRLQEAWAEHLDVPVELTNSIAMKLRLIPPGEFMMGSSDEEVAEMKRVAESAKKPWEVGRIGLEASSHQVRITKPFYLGTTEVTRGLFRQFVAATGYVTDAEKDGKGGAAPAGGTAAKLSVQIRRSCGILIQGSSGRKLTTIPSSTCPGTTRWPSANG